MRVMKNSGIDWINIVPNSWHTTRLKSVLVERNEKNNPIKTTNLLSLSIERGVFPYSEKTGGGNKAKENFEDYKLAYVNDIVLNSMNVVVGAVGISKYYGCVSPVYYTLYSRNNELYNINYYNYIFQSEVFQKNLWGLGNGIVVKESDNGKLNTIRMRIPMEKLNGVILPVPSIEEQEKIANFLDEKTKEIDVAIEKTKETIEDYKKLRKTIINKAVTKGIDNDIEMVDSRIKWIGNIPKGWKKSKFKYCTDIIMGQSPSGDDIKLEGQTLFMQGNKEFGEIFPHPTTYCETCNKYSRVGDILMSVRAPVGAINESDKIYGIGRGLCSIKVNKNIDKHFFKYFLEKSIDDMSYYSNGSVFDAITTEVLNNFYIFEPSTNEQIRIVEYLNNKCGEINKLIESKEKIVEELEKYKKSVIYEYVTGKKEVK